MHVNTGVPNIHDLMTKEKKSKYSTKYKIEWEIAYSWLSKSVKGVCFAFCKLSEIYAGKNGVSKLDTDIQPLIMISTRKIRHVD